MADLISVGGGFAKGDGLFLVILIRGLEVLGRGSIDIDCRAEGTLKTSRCISV